MRSRTLQLLIKTWRLRVSDLIAQLRLYYQQRACPHIWQAALVQSKPGRTCKLCDLAQQLSREDFYAQFGERYQAMLYQTPVAPIIRRESSVSHIEIDRVQ